VDGKAMGMLQAKPKGVTLLVVADQAAKYSIELPENMTLSIYLILTGSRRDHR